MKQLFTLSLLFLGTLNAEANPFKQKKHSLNDAGQFRRQMLNMTRSHQPLSKTTALQQRVKAECLYDISGIIPEKRDTVVFRYSNGRGSRFDYNQFAHNYSFPEGTPGLANVFSMGDISTQADSVWYYEKNNNNTYSVYESVAYQYNAANQVASCISDYNQQVEKLVTSYDAQGRLVALSGLTWDVQSQNWDSLQVQKFIYNAQDELLSDSTYLNIAGNWELIMVSAYSYTGGNLTYVLMKADMMMSGTLTDYAASELSYDANGDMNLMEIYYDTGNSTLALFTKDSFAYHPVHKYYTFQETSYYDAGNSLWTPDTRLIRTVNTAGLPDTSSYYYWDDVSSSWFLADVYTAMYNSYENPTVMNSFQNGGSGLEENMRYFFYYEEFDPLSVKPAMTAENIVVFPNPAQERISLKWNADGKAVSVSLLNAAGQTVHSEQLVRRNATEQVSIAHLVPGMYWLTVTDAAGNVVTRNAIVKQ